MIGEPLLTMRDLVRAVVPPWMTDRVERGFVNGYKFMYAIGQTCDLAIQFALEGMWARFPEFAPDAALPYIGRDRKINRAPNESRDAYVDRLIAWLETAKKRGSATQLLRDLQTYAAPITPTIRIVTQSGVWWSLLPDGSVVRQIPGVLWDWDLNYAKWDRFWVVLYASEWSWVRDGTWGDGELWGHDPNSTWGSTAKLEEVQSIRQLIRDNMGADQVCPRIIVCFDDDMFDPNDTPVIDPIPDGSWEHHGKDDGSGNWIPARDPRAIYWRGP